MDILDIDEALRDDSFIFLEDKTHDDVSNILQQWKSNSCLPPQLHLQQQQQQQQQSQSQQQQPQEQVYKLNSRTFTRPKRKTVQNLETQFANTSYNNAMAQHQQQQQQQQQHQQKNVPTFNLEIGGLVTTMHKSFLQDTSPPSSICSSMDVSMDRMNNSLITSADFTNINFLQSTQSLDFNQDGDKFGGGGGGVGGGAGVGGYFNLNNKMTNDGYTLNDMIRDRKALESLTLSGDGTLIKDSNIAQIDDISLALSKTASGCSTMDNSTESVEVPHPNHHHLNQTVGVVLLKNDCTFEKNTQSDATALNGGDALGILERAMASSDEMIGDTTFNLIENSMCASSNQFATMDNSTTILPPTNAPLLNETHNVDDINSPTIAVASAAVPPLLEETVCLSEKVPNTNNNNTTFDCQQQQQLKSDDRCETPENPDKSASAMKFCVSTPHTTDLHYRKQQYTPSLKILDDVNISPIIAQHPHHVDATRIMHNTFEEKNEQDQEKQIEKEEPLNINNINSNTFCGQQLPQLQLDSEEEMLEHIENPNCTFNKSFQRPRQQQEPQSAADIEMQNVMDMAQAEAELLASNADEEEFEHMLDEFSRIELNAEQLKMKKSLDSIKKRFNKNEREISREAKDMRELLRTSGELLPTDESPRDVRNDELLRLRESLKQSNHHANAMASEETKASRRERESMTNGLSSSSSTSAGSNSSGGGGGERLLSRRSRLYDDINMSTLSTTATTTTTATPSSLKSSPISTSFTVQKHECNSNENANEELKETDDTEINVNGQEKTDDCNDADVAENKKTIATAYKLAEKRERDRDRFKTIKIVKQRNQNGGDGVSSDETQLNVPCIDDHQHQDDDGDHHHTNDNKVNDRKLQQYNNGNRYSRRDQTTAATTTTTTSKLNTNYLTYKKPKEKQQMSATEMQMPASLDDGDKRKSTLKPSRLEPRSLSRPRYISGIQKFTLVGKATSAGDLEKTSSSNNDHVNSHENANISNHTTAATTNETINRNTSTTEKKVAELKSPMGIKSKSFHNLSSNFGYNGGANASATTGGGASGGQPASRLSTFGLRKLNNTIGLPAEKQKPDDTTVFKVPRLVSGLRAPGATGAKRSIPTRPSSAYYSSNVTAKISLTNDADLDAGRHSPTDSMSSASSRSSIQSSGSGIKSLACKSNLPTAAPTATLTKITTGSTGIPKPSGLRPPSSSKWSGLPKPTGIVRR